MLKRLLRLRTMVLVGVVGLLLAITAFGASGGFSHPPRSTGTPAQATPAVPTDTPVPSASPSPTPPPPVVAPKHGNKQQNQGEGNGSGD